MNAGVDASNRFAKSAHIGSRGDHAVPRHDRVEIECQGRVKRPRPLLGTAAAGLIDQLRGLIAEREDVARRERPRGRKQNDHIAVGVGAAEMVQPNLFSADVETRASLKHEVRQAGILVDEEPVARGSLHVDSRLN